MSQKKFESESVIIRYGDVGSEYFVLAKGRVRVTVYESNCKPNDPNLADKIKFEKTLEADKKGMIGFGEIALLYNDKRTATITAETTCETWILSGDVFKHIIASNQLKRREISFAHLDRVKMFNSLNTHEKMKLIDGLQI